MVGKQVLVMVLLYSCLIFETFHDEKNNSERGKAKTEAFFKEEISHHLEDLQVAATGTAEGCICPPAGSFWASSGSLRSPARNPGRA